MENLNTRLAAAIKLEMDGEDANVRKEMLKKYKKHFSKNYKKRSLVQLYLDFLFSLEEHLANTTENANATEDANENSTNTNIMSSTTWSEWKKRVKKGFFDCYDLAAMALLAHGWLDEGDDDEFAQMYIDEAQDYGVAVYYVIKKRMPKTAFMIMGDVSQNINYDSGMNDWEELRQIMLPDSIRSVRAIETPSKSPILRHKFLTEAALRPIRLSRSFATAVPLVSGRKMMRLR